MPVHPGAAARAAAMTWEAVAAGRRRFDTACLETPSAPPMQRTLLLVTLVLVGALTAAALRQHGDWGIVGPHLKSFGGAKMFVNLVIALTRVRMWHDAKARGRNIRPWIVLTLPAGTIGPLPYLMTRKPA